jgi:hypothetical protein
VLREPSEELRFVEGLKEVAGAAKK